MTSQSILIIEDEDNLRNLLAKILSLEGYTTFLARNVAEGASILQSKLVHLVITDVMLPDVNGIDFTKTVKQQYPDIEVIVLTAFGKIDDGVTAMKLGAFDYLVKGENDEKLPLVVQKALEKAVMNRQVRELEYRVANQSSFSKIIGNSSEVDQMIHLAKKVAVTDTTVLLLGDTGTGKELLAEAIHLASRRRKGPFIPINCAAIPKELQESELFGHKKGAFTGANSDKKGYFEVAHGGTIFLDELAEMNGDLQAKLLRILETKLINKVGETEAIPIDVRIIAATNKHLNQPIDDSFRKDLYFRLSTFTINLPSLKERGEDISLLAIYFLKKFSESFGKKINKISSDFKRYLKEYSWPGNIRELRNVIERAVILEESDELSIESLPKEILLNSESTLPLNEKNIALKDIEKKHIINMLDKNEGDKSVTAQQLGIGIATLYRKLKEYGYD